MRNSLGKLCVILATLLLLFSIGFFTVSALLRDGDYIEDKYRSLGVSEQLGISTPDLAAATNVLLDYMRGERANIRFAARVNGAELDDIFYHDKEVVHMAEVQVLWFTLSAIARYGLLAAVVLAIVGALLAERGVRRVIFARGMIWGTGIFGGVLIVMGIWAVVDFNSFWTVFHFIIFPSSLFQYIAAGSTPEAMSSLNWVLDENSIMVSMLMPIFPSLVLRCALFVAAEIAFVLIVGLLLRYIGTRKMSNAVAEIVTVERDVNEPVEIEGPDLVLSHQLRNAPPSRREALRRSALGLEPEDEPQNPEPAEPEEPAIELAEREPAEAAEQEEPEEPAIELAEREPAEAVSEEPESPEKEEEA